MILSEMINKVICSDCLPILKSLPDKCIDLVLCDPPYNVGFDYGELHDDNKVDYEKWCKDWFTECERISNAVLISSGVVNVGMWGRIKDPKWIVAWLKPAAMGRSPFGFCNWEPILFYGKSKKQTGLDVIKAPIISDKTIDGHPCPKPLRWAEELIALTTNENDLVLDCFLGSGTTAVACKKLNRRFIGIEISPEYCKIAEQRLKQGVLNF